MKQFIKCPECGIIDIVGLFIDGARCKHCESCIHKDHYKPIPALSIRQPWASIIAEGIKDIENRTWKTNFRGTVLIHAGLNDELLKQKFEFLKDSQLTEIVHKNKTIELFGSHLNRGGIIGYVDIVDCVQNSNSNWAEKGLNHFVLKNAATLPFTPCKGKQSFFKPEIE